MATLYVSLACILAVVVFFPFLFKAVEERLEFFLLLAGVASVSAAGIWSRALLLHAALAPLPICFAVLLFGALFSLLRRRLDLLLLRASRRLGTPSLAFLLVAGLGLLSGVLTALIAALALSEALALLKLERRSKLRLAVAGCYSIGLGAALTPLGEPLGSIVISRLGTQDFWFLARLLGAWVLPLIFALGFLAAFLARGKEGESEALRGEEGFGRMAYRAFKVYVFVVGLELLGAGFNPATGDLLKSMPPWALYWASLVSAALDNASLAAAGLSPQMSTEQLRAFMLGLMISGGMMVPGNFPNIVCAGKLKIGFKEWAWIALPSGLLLMLLVFALLSL
jgi:predicted cation transporter